MTEMVYCYDGSFDGFLCCIFESYAKHEVLTAINSDEDSEPTLYPTRRIVTDREHARRVYRKIRQLSPAAADLVRRLAEEGQSLSDAARQVARETGYRKGELYRLAAGK